VAVPVLYRSTRPQTRADRRHPPHLHG
jgi:hypothetical protein